MRREGEFVRAAAAARAQSEEEAEAQGEEGLGSTADEQGALTGGQEDEEAAFVDEREGAQWEWEAWEEEMGSSILNEYEPAFGDG